MFCGAFGYADDLKLLIPTIRAMSKMVIICEQYATRYHVMFDAKNSQVIIYRCSAKRPPNPNITVNGKIVYVTESVIHLGHLMTSNIYDFNLSKCIGDINRQCNMF